MTHVGVTMEWWVVLIIIVGLVLAFFLSGMPVAFAFLSLNIIGFAVWFGGIGGIQLLVPSAFSCIATFTFVCIPMFIFLGEILFQTGLASLMIDNLAMWVGRIPGSLSLVAIGTGTLFAMMSGSAVSGTALFGSTLVPEMRRRGYSKEMCYGPILGAGSLATIIPPSILVVVVATLSRQSVGGLLIATIVPGFILAGLYAIYVLVRARLQPHLAPAFAPSHITWGRRIKALAVISPASILIFLVLGLIFLGVATPSEAASLGATGALVLTAAYGRLTWSGLKKALWATLGVTTMVFMICMSAAAFSQLLAYTGVVKGLSSLAGSLPIPPILIVAAMQVVMIFMGMFIEDISMAMICIPIFFPIIRALGLDPMWFGILMLVNMEMAIISPPFGLLLFTLKGVAPEATMADIYRAGLPFILLILILLVTLIIFPTLVTWLPGLM